jgi:peptidyl-tRNA hydrolase, PTH2 family
MPDVEELKMWLVVRGDIEIPKGKLAAQAGHGFCTAIYEALKRDKAGVVSVENIDKYQKLIDLYFQQNQPKITVVAKNLAALERAYKECQEALIPSSFIVDEGRTVFVEPTATVVGIGPCYRSDLPKFVKRLQLMKDDDA